MSATVKVKGTEFEPQSQSGQAGESVTFINKRDVSVTVNLKGGKWSQSTVTLAKDGNNGSSVTVNINASATGKAEFDAPKLKKDSPAADKDTIIGDIDIDPTK